MYLLLRLLSVWNDKKTATWCKECILTCSPGRRGTKINHPCCTDQLLKMFLSSGYMYVRKRPVLRCYFLANEIFMAFACVILKPCSASRAAPACTSFSNSTKAMSWRPGTRRTSLNPGNLNRKQYSQIQLSTNGWMQKNANAEKESLLTGWRAWRAWARLSPLAGWWGRGCDWEDFLPPVRMKDSGGQNRNTRTKLYIYIYI